MRIHGRMSVNAFVLTSTLRVDARWCHQDTIDAEKLSCVPYYSRRRKGSMRLRKEMNDITAYQGSHGLTTLLELSNAPL
ncbi:hypothetical protein P692DRAFT_20838766 [Suillus brevipes Sb2]|nr:hypothetical protein P692DRAFT_20838766 [Suillus brevipes Sb2]